MTDNVSATIKAVALNWRLMSDVRKLLRYEGRASPCTVCSVVSVIVRSRAKLIPKSASGTRRAMKSTSVGLSEPGLAVWSTSVNRDRGHANQHFARVP